MFGITKCLVLLAALQSYTAAFPLEARQAAPGRYIFAFGDSYTTNGFNLNGAQPNSANAQGNPNIGTPVGVNRPGTFAGGLNYIGYLSFFKNTTLTYLYDLAVGGAVVDKSITNAGPAPFTDQVFSFFNPKYANKPSFAPWNSGNTIFFVHFGINDIQNSYRSKQINDIVPRTISRYFELCQNLYQSGARKFVLINVPNLGRSPKIQSEDPLGAGNWNNWATAFNKQLAQGAANFQSSHSGSQVKVYDFYTFMNKILNNPSTFGFRDNTCRGDPNNCVWNDDFHPVYKFDELKANDMLGTLRQIGW